MIGLVHFFDSTGSRDFQELVPSPMAVRTSEEDSYQGQLTMSLDGCHRRFKIYDLINSIFYNTFIREPDYAVGKSEADFHSEDLKNYVSMLGGTFIGLCRRIYRFQKDYETNITRGLTTEHRVLQRLLALVVLQNGYQCIKSQLHEIRINPFITDDEKRVIKNWFLRYKDIKDFYKNHDFGKI